MKDRFKWMCTFENRPSIRVFINTNKNKAKFKTMWKNHIIVDEEIVTCPAYFDYFLISHPSDLNGIHTLIVWQLYEVRENMAALCGKDCDNCKEMDDEPEDEDLLENKPGWELVG
jgi:hypothetical protein